MLSRPPIVAVEEIVVGVWREGIQALWEPPLHGAELEQLPHIRVAGEGKKTRSALALPKRLYFHPAGHNIPDPIIHDYLLLQYTYLVDWHGRFAQPLELRWAGQ